jgi:hypothetical protein
MEIRDAGRVPLPEKESSNIQKEKYPINDSYALQISFGASDECLLSTPLDKILLTIQKTVLSYE